MISLLSPIMATAASTSRTPLLPRDCVQYIMQFTDTGTKLSMFLVHRTWYHAVDRVVWLMDTFYYLPEMFRDDIIQRRQLSACASSSSLSALQDDFRWGYIDVMVLKVEAELQAGVKCFPESLKSLCLRDSVPISDDCVAQMSTLASLTLLDISDCTLITDAGFSHLSTLPSLTKLHLSGCKFITDTGFSHLSKVKSLTNLHLSGCTLITDTALAHVSSLTSLTLLDLWYCKFITDTGLSHLSTLTSLTSLSFWYCNLITDAGLSHLSTLTSL
eukprot:PhF_6_TR38174/c4_g1_i1/m.57055/K10280/FBXL14; F-box and leucine-rich repeat protein 14